MKTRSIILCVLAAALWIASNVAMAHHANRGNHRGWERPGHPHNYASPKAQHHP